MQITKAVIRQLREGINHSLVELAEKHNLQIKAGNASYNEDSVTFKLECNSIQDGVVITKEMKAWDDAAKLFDFDHLSVGDTIKLGKDMFIIKGYNSRASKMPIQVEAGGKSYKISVNHLLTYNPKPVEA